MISNELLNFIDRTDINLRKYHEGEDVDNDKIALFRTVKLGEEFGELCDEILCSVTKQREDKMEKHTKESLEKEFADVIVTTLLTAKAMNVDIKEGFKKVIEKVDKRFDMHEK